MEKTTTSGNTHPTHNAQVSHVSTTTIGWHITHKTYVTYPLIYLEFLYYTTGLDVKEEKHNVINSILI